MLHSVAFYVLVRNSWDFKKRKNFSQHTFGKTCEIYSWHLTQLFKTTNGEYKSFNCYIPVLFLNDNYRFASLFTGNSQKVINGTWWLCDNGRPYLDCFRPTLCLKRLSKYFVFSLWQYDICTFVWILIHLWFFIS